jgi:sortase A
VKKVSKSTIVLTALLLVGFSVMLYPTFSNWWNSHTQSRAIANYEQAISEIQPEDYESLLEQAYAYNEELAKVYAPFENYDQVSGYEDILDITGTGIMGYISIPTIKVELPIYHGTSEGVLNIATGHLQGSSLPVGGTNTHAVISAHRGLPSAKLFSDLDKLYVGDTFTITILNEVLTYEVEEILIIEPTEVDKLAVIPNGDYVTLMTCTPYGINTHRLLIRSHRIDTVYQSTVKVSADAVQVDPMLVVPVIASPFVVGLILFWVFGGKKRAKVNPEDILKKE